MYLYMGRKGKVIRIEAEGSRYIKGIEYGVQEEYVYHEVYVKGGFVYDPRYSVDPIKKKDYYKMIKDLNKDKKLKFTEIEIQD